MTVEWYGTQSFPTSKVKLFIVIVWYHRNATSMKNVSILFPAVDLEKTQQC